MICFNCNRPESNIQNVLDSIAKISLNDLYKVRVELEREIKKQNKLLLDSVSLEKVKEGVYLKHAINGSYLCKKAAFAGRWRMWKMVPRECGLKRGPVVVKECIGGQWEDLDGLKIQVALGYYKDK